MFRLAKQTRLKDVVWAWLALSAAGMDHYALADVQADIRRSSPPQRQIADVLIESARLEVPDDAKPGQKKVYRLAVEGSFKREDWSLIFGETAARSNEEGEFKIYVPIKSALTPVILTAVGPVGQVEREQILISIKDFDLITGARPVAKSGSGEEGSGSGDENTKKKKDASGAGKFRFSPGAGYTMIAWDLLNEDAAAGPFRGNAITTKLGITYSLAPPEWDLGFLGFYTALPFTEEGQETIRFLGLNGRVGYTLPFIKYPFRVTLMGGYYYSTTFVSVVPGETAPRREYQHINGPQVYPAVGVNFTDRWSLNLYGKFSPVSNKFSFLDLSNREIAYGAAISHRFRNGDSLSFTVDTSDLFLDITTTGVDADGNAETTRNIFSIKTTTLGISYAF